MSLPKTKLTSEKIIEEEKSQERNITINADLHAHSSSSDGPPMTQCEKAANQAGLKFLGWVDHANLHKRKTKHDRPSYPGTSEESFTDPEHYSSRRQEIRRIDRKYKENQATTREEEVMEELEKRNFSYVEQDIEGYLNNSQETSLQGVGDGIELDYESGESNIATFLEHNDFDYRMYSIHFIDHVYIKSDEETLEYIFEEQLGDYLKDIDNSEPLNADKSREIIEKVEEQKKEMVNKYFEELNSLIKSPTLQTFDPVIIAHPDLIERNSILKDAVREKHYNSVIESFRNSKAIPEVSGKGLERQIPEEIAEPYKKAYRNGEKPEEISKEDRNKLVNAVEREESTKFIRKILETDLDVAYGSDAHRPWEIPARKHMTEEILNHKNKEVIDHQKLTKK